MYEREAILDALEFIIRAASDKSLDALVAALDVHQDVCQMEHRMLKGQLIGRGLIEIAREEHQYRRQMAGSCLLPGEVDTTVMCGETA